MARQRRGEPLLDGELSHRFVVANEVGVQALDRSHRVVASSAPNFAEPADRHEPVELPGTEALRHVGSKS
jgi:hypothetical protein